MYALKGPIRRNETHNEGYPFKAHLLAGFLGVHMVCHDLAVYPHETALACFFNEECKHPVLATVTPEIRLDSGHSHLGNIGPGVVLDESGMTDYLVFFSDSDRGDDTSVEDQLGEAVRVVIWNRSRRSSRRLGKKAWRHQKPLRVS